MAHELDSPNPPDLLNPAPHAPLAGDWHDDDAQAYGQDFASAVEGPQERTGIPHAKNEVKPTTRLLSARASVGTVNGTIQDPVMLLPPDVNRKALQVQVLGQTGELVTIAGSKTGCFNGANWQAAATGSILAMDEHTGALWAYSISAQAIVVTVIAVTV